MSGFIACGVLPWNPLAILEGAFSGSVPYEDGRAGPVFINSSNQPFSQQQVISSSTHITTALAPSQQVINSSTPQNPTPRIGFNFQQHC